MVVVAFKSEMAGVSRRHVPEAEKLKYSSHILLSPSHLDIDWVYLSSHTLCRAVSTHLCVSGTLMLEY